MASELDKWAASCDERMAIVNFMDWLGGEKGIGLTTHEGLANLLDAYFEINASKLETERRALLTSRALLAKAKGQTGESDGD